MNESEIQCLQQDDRSLFQCGTCHVFAVELQKRFIEEAYVLKRASTFRLEVCTDCYGLQRETKIPCHQGHHIFATKGAFVMDIFGVRTEMAYLASIAVNPSHGSADAPTIPPLQAELINTSEVELLTHHHHESNLGSVNCWELFTGKEFVAEASKRAIKIIEQDLDKFPISAL